MKDYLKEFLYSYHWDPAKALLRAQEARIMSEFDYQEPILDLGCGDGVFTSELLPKHNLIGLDLNHKKLLKVKNLRLYSNVIVADAKKMALKDNSFNSILINSFLEHINGSDLENVIKQVHRILKINGRAFITVNTSSFGSFDPLILLFNKLRIKLLSDIWQGYRNNRLALLSLRDFSYWDNLFKKINFKVVTAHYYLPPRSEKSFFIWTELQYLGISRVNLGSIVRCLSKILSYLGIDIHRKIIANIFSPVLNKWYLDDSNQGSCLFFILEKI